MRRAVPAIPCAARDLLRPRSLTLAVAVSAALHPLEAQTALTTTVELGYSSGYLFAGIPFSSDAVAQARVSVSAGSFTVNGFSVWDQDRSEVTELDVYTDYYVQAAPTVGVFVGGALYSFDLATSWQSTPEL